jgi:hypothetical protein
VTATGAQLVERARRYLGVPYRFGGTDPKTGLDCSGLTQLVAREVGLTLPRVTGAQQAAGLAVYDLAHAQPGDLVFFGRPVSGHVGIYLGNNQIIHAPRTGDVVKVSTIWEKPSYIRRITAGPIRTGDPLGAIGGGVLDGAKGAVSGLDSVGAFLGQLGQERTWLRVAQVVGGLGLVVGGVVIVGHGVIGDVASSIIPAGKAVKAAAGAAS